MLAVASLATEPDDATLLARRLAAGWRPTPSYLQAGPTVLGIAAAVPPEEWTRPPDGWSPSCAIDRPSA